MVNTGSSIASRSVQQMLLDNNSSAMLAQCDSFGNMRVVERIGEPVVLAESSTESGLTIDAMFPPAGVEQFGFLLENITCRLSTTPTTPSLFTIDLMSAHGELFDICLLSFDPSQDGGVSSIVWSLERPFLCLAGDSIRVRYANPDACEYGLRIVTRVG